MTGWESTSAAPHIQLDVNPDLCVTLKFAPESLSNTRLSILPFLEEPCSLYICTAECDSTLSVNFVWSFCIGYFTKFSLLCSAAHGTGCWAVLPRLQISYTILSSSAMFPQKRTWASSYYTSFPEFCCLSEHIPGSPLGMELGPHLAVQVTEKKQLSQWLWFYLLWELHVIA